MEEMKLSVAEFATLCGTTPKTVYERLKNYDKLPENERLKTVRERVNGRGVTLISTNKKQIDFYSQIYNKNTSLTGEYYNIVTENNEKNTYIDDKNEVKNNADNILFESYYEKIIKLNEDYNNRLEQKNTELLSLHEELMKTKQNQLLLEDKANREGLYINEINQLKKENGSKNTVIKLLISVIVILLLLSISVITYFVTVNYLIKNANVQSNTQIEKVIYEENKQ